MSVSPGISRYENHWLRKQATRSPVEGQWLERKGPDRVEGMQISKVLSQALEGWTRTEQHPLVHCYLGRFHATVAELRSHGLQS